MARLRLDPDLVEGIRKEAAMARMFYAELVSEENEGGNPSGMTYEQAAMITAAWIGASVSPEYVLGPEIPDDPLGL